MVNNIFQHKILDSETNVTVYGLNSKVQATYVLDLFSVVKKSIVLVTNTLYEANNLYKALSFLNSNNVLFFPMDDFLVSEAIAISPDLMSKRIETLNELLDEEPKIVVTNLMGYLRFLPDKKLWQKLFIKVSKNDEISRESLINKLNMMGYKKENIVTKTGEYANRGYILDVFPYGYDNPVRIEFFDNVIDEIRTFNVENQLSISKIKDFQILPFTEFINEKGIYDIPNRQSLLPRVVNKVSCLSEFAGNNLVIYNDLTQLKLAYERILKEVIEFKETDKYNISSYMHDLIELIPTKYLNISTVDNYNKNFNSEVYSSSDIENFNNNFDRINHFIGNNLKNNKKIVVCLHSDLMIDDFINKIKYKSIITNFDALYDDKVNIVKKKIYNGFIIGNLVFISSNEIYKKNQTVNYKSKFRYGVKIKDINKLQIGDYVVHSSHGIGRYLGIVTLESKGMKKDYIHLQYKGDDKLYIPVEKIEYISKYSSKEGVMPNLNKLGGTEWVKQKARVKGKVKDIAKELLETSARRKLIPGFAFYADDEDQYAFENNFEYSETKDQLRAIKEIKEDMEKPQPMDRLLCGDVGYGKTEVAFRAMFKAIKSGKQVAFLCPTTILAKQHYENAVERFNGFGVNIEVLNRFVTPKKREEVIENLKNGKIDLVIGTHILLGKNITYKDLGLLVIDEEQRFGVTHKEKIKEYKNSIDVLTLSATPIPRTLQMSLTGMRGLSLIETPPAFRYPIQTYVLRENDQVIKDAIYKELARDGQVFILYNNVSKIENQVSRIQKLVPEALITFIHGQMPKNQIESTMEAFVEGKYNVLVCTTIIETGIDIQNANTLIVIDADYFGLSQLYQIRGRIGRGKNIGYAYLMYNKTKELNDIAVKRLGAIKEFTELGSGYALAIRDLSIRGAGDILGAQQSGFIDTLGYDMYLKILNEEIERIKGNVVEEQEDSIAEEKPFIQVSTHISDNYVDNEELKIEIHKKINTIDSFDKYELVKKELEDRFGKLNEEILVYMLEELFQVLAKEKGVQKVEQLTNKIIIYFDEKTSSKVDGIKLLTNLFKISPDFETTFINKKLKITLKISNLSKHFIYYLVKMIDIIE